MIIIADSGATKTDWRVLEGENEVHFETTGLSPFFNNNDNFQQALNSGFPSNMDAANVEEVFFYGSGCALEERGQMVETYLKNFFTNAKTHAYSDALGAAKALFGDNSGVVVILGTGCNVTFYDGKELKAQTPSLGYALGDEGSGAYIGRLLLRKYLYHLLPNDVCKLLEQQYDVSLSTILDSMYVKAKPSAYLASFVPFVVQHRNHHAVIQIVDEAFNDLYRYHLSAFSNLAELKIGVIGSVGHIFSDRLNALAAKNGFSISQYLQYPILKLVEYHRK